MTNLTVSLPESVKQFVDTEAAAGGFANSGDYLQDLILRAYREKARQQLEAKLLRRVEGVDRGEVADMTQEDWDEIRAEVERSHQKREAR